MVGSTASRPSIELRESAGDEAPLSTNYAGLTVDNSGRNAIQWLTDWFTSKSSTPHSNTGREWISFGPSLTITFPSNANQEKI